MTWQTFSLCALLANIFIFKFKFKFNFSPVTGIIISALSALKLLIDRVFVCECVWVCECLWLTWLCVSDVDDLGAPSDNSKRKYHYYNYNLRIVFQTICKFVFPCKSRKMKMLFSPQLPPLASLAPLGFILIREFCQYAAKSATCNMPHAEHATLAQCASVSLH